MKQKIARVFLVVLVCAAFASLGWAAIDVVVGINTTAINCQSATDGSGYTAARINLAGWRTIELAVVACDGGGSPANPVYIGGSNVTPANGFPICTSSYCAGSTWSANVTQPELYYVCKPQDAGTCIRVITAR